MKFSAGVSRSSQTTAAKACSLHSKISPVFLSHDICSDFAGAEQAVLGLINAHRLVDAMFCIRMLRIAFPTRCLLHQRECIWSIAIDFVGRHVDKYGVRAILARRLEHH